MSLNAFNASVYRVCLWCLILFCSMMLLSGCGGGERFKATTTVDQFQKLYAEQQTKDKEKNKFNIMPLTIGGEEDGDYLLGAGDLLAIKVFEAEELNSEVRISSSGIVNLPLIGDVKVMNLSSTETEHLIEAMYKKDYLYDPHVSVYIKEHVSKQITLIGAVNKPGTYDYVSRRRLLDVLAIGNGLKDEAGSLAYITRHNPKTNKSVNYIVDLDDLVKNGNMAQNHLILGGDVVFIPESGQCFIDGAVRKPGTYKLESNMTITEALTMAGGLAGYADSDSIKLIRFMGLGKERQIVSLSYKDMQAGVGDTLFLKDQDVIYAESSASGKLFSGTGFTIGFLGTGVNYRNPEQ